MGQIVVFCETQQHTAVLYLTVNTLGFNTSCSRKLIWLQQQPENVTPRIALLVSVTYEDLRAVYLPQPGTVYPQWILTASVIMCVFKNVKGTCSLNE